MNPSPADFAQVAEALAALRGEVARLNDRVAALEAAALADVAVPLPAPAAAPAPAEPEELGEELVMVIGAAIAAFLGKKAHIRQIRLIGSPAWGMQGRVTIQASHTLASNN
ncbi:MAG: hypothetical protein U0800_19325 [Isosphaeraceae bacterium]